ncbi:hypothetical protein BH10ACT3_BH10ACT3_15480 [soil metagenome]
MTESRARFGVATPDATSTTGTSGTDFASLLAAADGTDAGSLGTALLNALQAAAGTATAGTASTGGPTGDDVVQTAKQYLGIPYVWGGTNPATGLDCSGFVQSVYQQFGIDLPRVSRDQAKQGVAVPSIAQAQPGDLIAFGEPVDHIAIYVGDGKIIQAPHSGDVVKISDMSRTPTAIRRILPQASAGASTPFGATTGTSNYSGINYGTAAAGSVPIAQSTPALAQYASLFVQAGAKYGISANLLAAVAKVESGGNANAVSGAGAKGLMQFMPGTAAAFGIDPLDPAQAIDGAARLLSQMQTKFGSTELALASYNAGECAVRRAGGIPPYGETQAYVTKVMGLLGATT